MLPQDDPRTITDPLKKKLFASSICYTFFTVPDDRLDSLCFCNIKDHIIQYNVLNHDFPLEDSWEISAGSKGPAELLLISLTTKLAGHLFINFSSECKLCRIPFSDAMSDTRKLFTTLTFKYLSILKDVICTYNIVHRTPCSWTKITYLSPFRITMPIGGSTDMNYHAFDVEMLKCIFWYAVRSSFDNQSSCNRVRDNEGKLEAVFLMPKRSHRCAMEGIAGAKSPLP